MTSLLQFQLAHAILGALGFGCLYPAVVCGAGAWFPRHRGLVMGVVTAGGAVGQGVMPFLAETLLAAVDWRQTYGILASCVALAQTPVLFGVRRAGPWLGVPSHARASERLQPLQRPRLVALACAAFFCCACMGVPLIQLAGFASTICGSASAGALVMLAAMIAGAAGRIIFGLGADRIGNLRAYILASGLQTICLAVMPVLRTEQSVFAVSILFGFGFAGNMTCLLLCIRDEVPEQLFGAAVGLVMFVAWLGMGFGGYVGGTFMDITGGYATGFWIAVAFGMANLLILAALAQRARAIRCGESAAQT